MIERTAILSLAKHNRTETTETYTSLLEDA